VENLRWRSAAEAVAMEPALACSQALYSPSTGIIDSHGLMLALLGDAEAAGATLVTHTPVTGGRIVDGGFELDTGGTDPTMLRCRLLVNSAGLRAQFDLLIGIKPASMPLAEAMASTGELIEAAVTAHAAELRRLNP
jgi:L-2-hydroxyglutarate oxidase LhgO